MNGFAELSNLWHTIQAWLFPNLEDELGELDDQHRQFVAVCEICNPRRHLAAIAGSATVARPRIGWRCARHSSPKPCGTSPPPAN